MTLLHGKKILYIAMDDVLADLAHAIEHVDPAVRAAHAQNLDEIPGIFSDLKPVPGALDAFRRLSEAYHTYILSTAPWKNPGAWQDKLDWVQKHLGYVGYKRLIISPDRHLSKGDYLIDAQPNKGALPFEGEWIRFGSAQYPDWKAVLEHLHAVDKVPVH
jgi:5'(3')-deoxyribonucleotidase